jgi:predicted transcriptional regulator
MNRKKDTRQLTEVELELMTIMWKLEEGSVSDVLAEVAASRKMAYTSAATIMKILTEKKFLSSQKQGKTYIYRVAVSKASYESRSINNMLKKLFNDAPVAMVARLVENEKVSEDQLEAMKKLLDQRLGK